MNYYNMYLEGKAKERLFAEAYISHFQISESDVVYASPQEDKAGIDLIIQGVSYDVKGLKRVRRGDDEYSYSLTWIELKNVAGNCGSVAKADRKAFETEDGWVCVSTTALIRLIFDKVEFVHDEFPLYKLKTRPGRSDLITLVEIKDLKEKADLFIPKQLPY